MTKKEYTRLMPVSLLEQNEGQLEGLPKNPRYIAPDKIDALKRSIKASPEFLLANPLKIYRMDKSRYIVIAGNMRLKACKELGITEVPCYIFKQDTIVEKLREFAIKDNLPYGKTDWEVLKLEWEPSELEAWDFEVPEWLDEQQDGFDEEPYQDELIAEGKQKPFVIKLTCLDENQMQDFSKEIDVLIEQKFNGAFYSVSGGEC